MTINEWWQQIRAVLGFELYTSGGRSITLSTLLWALAVVVITLWASRLAQRAAQRALSLGKVQDPARIALVQRLMHYGILAVGGLVVLQTLGVNLSALFAAGAVTAVAVGFAAQAIFENLTSGLILLGEGSIKPGDVLQVDGKIVRVQDLGFRATIVRTLDEEDLILPNSTLVRGTVTNFTFRDSLYRLRTRVGVVYGADMAKVRKVLQRTAAAVKWRSKPHEPRVLLVDFGDSAVIWDVSVWIDDPWRAQVLRSELNEAVWWALKEAGITIAFPQLDVHFDAVVERALGAGSRNQGSNES